MVITQKEIDLMAVPMPRSPVLRAIRSYRQARSLPPDITQEREAKRHADARAQRAALWAARPSAYQWEWSLRCLFRQLEAQRDLPPHFARATREEIDGLVAAAVRWHLPLMSPLPC